MKLTLILLSISALCLYIGTAFCDELPKCAQPNAHLENNSGKLNVTKNMSPCGFVGEKTSNYLAIKTEDLNLKANEKLSLNPNGNTTQNYEFKPPFDTGYIVSGLEAPTITFNFEDLDNSTMEIEYVLNTGPLPIPINGDSNNQIHINPVELDKIDIEFTKSIPGTIHLEVSGANIRNGNHPKHALIKNSTTTISLDMVSGQTVTVRTSPVFENCSQTYKTINGKDYRLEGPPASDNRKNYKCVNLFARDNQDAIFVVDFTNFIDIVDDEDRLIIDDGHSNSTAYIVKANAYEYTGQVRYFKGESLAVVYNSPRVIRPSNIQFELSVKSRNNVVIVDAVKSMEFTRPIQYVLQPQREEYASIQTSSLNLKSNLTIITDKHYQVDFEVLPPIIAANDAGSSMTLDYTSKSKSSGSVNYLPLKSNCHRLSTVTSDGFSVTNVTGSCIWTIAPKEPVILRFDYIDLPNGCLILTQLPSSKQIFNRCNLSPAYVLPPFMIEKAFVNVTSTSNGSRLDATISRSPVSDENKVSLTPVVNIASPAHPVAYPLTDRDTKYTLNTTKKGKAYALSVLDLDLRSGEKLMVENNQIDDVVRRRSGVMNITDKVTTIRIDRSKVDMNDLNNHRGFALQSEQFDRIIQVTKSPYEAPRNLTSVLFKISTSLKPDTFGKRIKYNITFLPPPKQNFSVSVIDSRVLNGRQIYGEKYHDYSTSDTILIRYMATAVNVMLPPMKIEYSLVDCNKTVDHVCDNGTRCVPKEKCKEGALFCDDKTDMQFCAGIPTPVPAPKIIETGVGGVTVFFVSVIMLVVGALSALYGPDVVRVLETRIRSGQYTTFTSSD